MNIRLKFLFLMLTTIFWGWGGWKPGDALGCGGISSRFHITQFSTFPQGVRAVTTGRVSTLLGFSTFHCPFSTSLLVRHRSASKINQNVDSH